MSGDDDPTRYDNPNREPIDPVKAEIPEPKEKPMYGKNQRTQKDRGPIPARQTNGYYADHNTGDRLRSVTTILGGGVPKPALMFWAAKMVADSAFENLPTIVAAMRHPQQFEELRAWVKKAHTRKKDERAEVGSLVHTLVESRILGTELPPVIKVGDTEWAIDGEELAPFLANFLAFEKEWKPKWTASEMVVANPAHNHAGTLDYMVSARGKIGDALRARGYKVPVRQDILGDTKTGGEWDRITSAGYVHGVYPEAGLQMSAYRKATVCWLRDGQRVPMPATPEVGVVLHLRPEGYRLYPARCGDAEYVYFRHAQMIDEWCSRVASARADDPVLGAALDLAELIKKEKP